MVDKLVEHSADPCRQFATGVSTQIGLCVTTRTDRRTRLPRKLGSMLLTCMVRDQSCAYIAGTRAVAQDLNRPPPQVLNAVMLTR